MKLSFLVLVIVLSSSASAWEVTFTPSSLKLSMGEDSNVTVRVVGLTPEVLEDEKNIQIKIIDENIARIDTRIIEQYEGIYQENLKICGVFLGSTKLFVEIKLKNNQSEVSNEMLSLTVTREERIVDIIFTATVGIFVSVLYISFGAALDLPHMKQIIIRPVGPVIGFVSQFVFMPLFSYGLGKIMFPGRFALQLGIFFVGIAPGGAMSNIWTVLLGGNMNLSVVMTTLSTFMAFGMMPFWIVTLGRHIFDNLGVPYDKTAFTIFALIVPLGIGIAIQTLLPKVTEVLIRILKPFALILLVVVTIFAFSTNLHILQLFTWEIIFCGLLLPWAGFLFGYLMSKLFQVPPADALAISIETGIQNTGIAIFLLRFTLDQPEADLTSIVPVCAFIMTPIPLMILYAAKTIRERFCRPQEQKEMYFIPKEKIDGFESS